MTAAQGGAGAAHRSHRARDPYADLAESACACCRAHARLHRLRALHGAGCAAGQRQLRTAERAADLARDEHLHLRRSVLGC